MIPLTLIIMCENWQRWSRSSSDCKIRLVPSTLNFIRAASEPRRDCFLKFFSAFFRLRAFPLTRGDLNNSISREGIGRHLTCVAQQNFRRSWKWIRSMLSLALCLIDCLIVSSHEADAASLDHDRWQEKSSRNDRLIRTGFELLHKNADRVRRYRGSFCRNVPPKNETQTWGLKYSGSEETKRSFSCFRLFSNLFLVFFFIFVRQQATITYKSS